MQVFALIIHLVKRSCFSELILAVAALCCMSACLPYGLPEYISGMKSSLNTGRNNKTAKDRFPLAKTGAGTRRAVLVAGEEESARTQDSFGHQFLLGVIPFTSLYLEHGVDSLLHETAVDALETSGYLPYLVKEEDLYSAVQLLSPQLILRPTVSSLSLNAYDALFFRILSVSGGLSLYCYQLENNGLLSNNLCVRDEISKREIKAYAHGPALASVLEQGMTEAFQKALACISHTPSAARADGTESTSDFRPSRPTQCTSTASPGSTENPRISGTLDPLATKECEKCRLDQVPRMISPHLNSIAESSRNPPPPDQPVSFVFVALPELRNTLPAGFGQMLALSYGFKGLAPFNERSVRRIIQRGMERLLADAGMRVISLPGASYSPSALNIGQGISVWLLRAEITLLAATEQNRPDQAETVMVELSFVLEDLARSSAAVLLSAKCRVEQSAAEGHDGYWVVALENAAGRLATSFMKQEQRSDNGILCRTQ
jgi:hypothetical protein